MKIRNSLSCAIIGLFALASGAQAQNLGHADTLTTNNPNYYGFDFFYPSGWKNSSTIGAVSGWDLYSASYTNNEWHTVQARTNWRPGTPTSPTRHILVAFVKGQRGILNSPQHSSAITNQRLWGYGAGAFVADTGLALEAWHSPGQAFLFRPDGIKYNARTAAYEVCPEPVNAAIIPAGEAACLPYGQPQSIGNYITGWYYKYTNAPVINGYFYWVIFKMQYTYYGFRVSADLIEQNPYTGNLTVMATAGRTIQTETAFPGALGQYAEPLRRVVGGIDPYGGTADAIAFNH